MAQIKGGHHDDGETVIDIGKSNNNNFTGGLEFTALTYTVVKKFKEGGKWRKQQVELLDRITGYAPKGCVTAVMGPSGAGKSTFLDALAGRIASGSLRGKVSLDGVAVSPSLIKRTSAYIMQDDQLFPMLTVYETLMFAADFRLGQISTADKITRVETLIQQLGLSAARNTYIGDEGRRGVSGGERRRVSIGVDIIHGPSLLFLDEPTSGLDSTSAHSVMEKVHQIAGGGSTVILTIHQPSSRILRLLDHLILLARGQLMYQGCPTDIALHLQRMGHTKLPKEENPIEYLIDLIQDYDQSEHGVQVMANFALTGVRPPPLPHRDVAASVVSTAKGGGGNGRSENSIAMDDFDRSLRSPYRTNTNHSTSWSATSVSQMFRLTPSRQRPPHKIQNPISPSPGYYSKSSEILPATPTPRSSDYTVNEDDYVSTEDQVQTQRALRHLGPKFANSFVPETWILMRRNFKNIQRTPELFLSRLVVLTFMGFMMATMFFKPPFTLQGITNRLSFFIFTVSVFFFSSNDAVPAFIQERFIFVRETSHNAYRASSYTLAGLITYLPFLALQAITYALIVWFALQLRGDFIYFYAILYASLLSTNSFVVFVSSVVPNYILGYAAVIAFTALFFLFCGYFVQSDAIPPYWKWMNKISIMTYPYEGLLMNQYQTGDVFGVDSSGRNVTGLDVLRGLHISIDESKRWKEVAVMLGWAVFYRILFYIIIRFASKNKRT